MALWSTETLGLHFWPPVLTQEGAFVHEERTPEYECSLSCMVSLHPVWFDLCKRTGYMLELIEKNRDLRICREKTQLESGIDSLIRS